MTLQSTGRGEVVDPNRPAELSYTTDSGEQVTGVEAEQLYAKFHKIKLRSHSWDVDADTGEATPVILRKPEVRTSRPTKRIVPDAFRTVRGSVRSRGAHYIVTTMKDHPRYHLVVEKDPSKDAKSAENRRNKVEFFKARGIENAHTRTQRQKAEDARAGLFAQGKKSLNPEKSARLYYFLQDNGIDPTDLSLPQRPAE